MKRPNGPPTTGSLRVGIAPSRPRPCICCGGPRATRSVPACWDHWIALPEDLRSEMVVTVGRGQIGRYGDCLMKAVRIWRQTGLWRSSYVATKFPPLESASAGSPDLHDSGKLVSFRPRLPNATPTPARKSALNRIEPRVVKTRRTNNDPLSSARIENR